MNLGDKAVMSTEECAEFCGGAVIFEELEAVYGTSLLKPLRTLPNGKRSWSRIVVVGVVNKAQSEGVLNDRALVQTAVEKLRTVRKNLKAREVC